MATGLPSVRDQSNFGCSADAGLGGVAGLARGGKDGVRLLGKGELKAKLAFKIAGVSKNAREAVEKAGGSIELIERKNPAELAAAKKGSRKAAAKGS